MDKVRLEKLFDEIHRSLDCAEYDLYHIDGSVEEAMASLDSIIYLAMKIKQLAGEEQ